MILSTVLRVFVCQEWKSIICAVSSVYHRVQWIDHSSSSCGKELQNSSVFIRRSLECQTNKGQTKSVRFVSRDPKLLLSFHMRLLYFLDEVWYTLGSAVQAAEARYWCSSWVLRRLDVCHINLAFFSIYSMSLSDVCHASGSLCCPEALSCLCTHWTRGHI